MYLWSCPGTHVYFTWLPWSRWQSTYVWWQTICDDVLSFVKTCAKNFEDVMCRDISFYTNTVDAAGTEGHWYSLTYQQLPHEDQIWVMHEEQEHTYWNETFHQFPPDTSHTPHSYNRFQNTLAYPSSPSLFDQFRCPSKHFIFWEQCSLQHLNFFMNLIIETNSFLHHAFDQIQCCIYKCFCNKHILSFWVVWHLFWQRNYKLNYL